MLLGIRVKEQVKSWRVRGTEPEEIELVVSGQGQTYEAVREAVYEVLPTKGR